MGGSLKDVMVIKRSKFNDERGYFSELLNTRSFPFNVIQINISKSKRSVIRGLHFQRDPYAQAKYVSVVKGRIYDVVVDLRRDSDAFGSWASYELSEDNDLSLFVPRGFAHGFQALEDDTLVMYAVDNHYHPESEFGIRWDDPELGISWPIRPWIVSKKDMSWPTLREALKSGALPGSDQS
ncbi:MAG: dTDP-4-dehydrorhamnose 3,5-epimerase [Conexivisphaerales archaeon]|nr:dTDP-4-dehydrorhamnose 3,5-epimerase [Conexivisphaerales archaeon]